MRFGRPLLVCALIAMVGSVALAAVAEARFFRSPSANIGCFISKQGVRCDIKKRSWEPPPKPDSCELDWGQGLTVGNKSRGRYVCAGDTTLNPEAPPLHRGNAIERGHFRCRTKRTGMRCVNEHTKHGFKLSRQRARRF